MPWAGKMDEHHFRVWIIVIQLLGEVNSYMLEQFLPNQVADQAPI